ncbi:hypothetical protein MTO96_020881 [Rhipicephalus appendiculatus]
MQSLQAPDTLPAKIAQETPSATVRVVVFPTLLACAAVLRASVEDPCMHGARNGANQRTYLAYVALLAEDINSDWDAIDAAIERLRVDDQPNPGVVGDLKEDPCVALALDKWWAPPAAAPPPPPPQLLEVLAAAGTDAAAYLTPLHHHHHHHHLSQHQTRLLGGPAGAAPPAAAPPRRRLPLREWWRRPTRSVPAHRRSYLACSCLARRPDRRRPGDCSTGFLR